jgi:hypothetical protein
VNQIETLIRPVLHDDGRLVIVAADHPARASLQVGDEPMAMADRDDLLRRLVLATRGLMAMVEPFISETAGAGQVRNVLTTDAVIHSVTVASALGATSAYTWLKIPVVDNMAQVMAATTLPTLLLGGDAPGSSEDLRGTWAEAMELVRTPPEVREVSA